jgi:hypothetical protein
MYRWPWRRFEEMFQRHLLRKAREELRQMRDMRLAAMDANTNYDSKENAEARRQRADGLQEAHEQAVRMLYAKEEPQQVSEIDEDPLFAPLRQRAQTLRAEADQPLVENAGAGRQLLEDR